MALQINNNITTVNRTPASRAKIDYIVIHYTANNGDTAWGNTNYFKDTYRGASAHYFADENVIWRSVLDSDIAWHCGTTGAYKHSLCRNTNSIGIEMCSRKDSAGVYYIKPETVVKTAALVKELMAKYNIPIGNVLRHYDVTGKICPEPFVRDALQWDKFKNLVVSKPTEQEAEEVKKLITIKMGGEYRQVSGYYSEADAKNLFTAEFIRDVLGFKVGYEPNTKAVTIDYDDEESIEIDVDGVPKKLLAVVRNALSRFTLWDIADITGTFDVGYNNETKRRTITTKAGR